MLRRTRIVLAVVFLVGITLLFAGIGQNWWGWMTKLQALPALLRVIGGATLGNIAILAAILLLTLVFGRIYCSVICPLGVFQDVVIWLRRQIGLGLNKIQVKRIKKNKAEGKETPAFKPYVKHFGYKKGLPAVRGVIFAAVLGTTLATGQLLLSLVAPYSAYGRIVRSVVGLAEGQSIVPALLVTAAVTLLVICVCAWFWGRDWCNTICPVGTVLGGISEFSLFKITIDSSKCTKCGRCYRGCKASCIDGEHHRVDYSRCVDCFDCIGRCKEGAVKYRFAPGIRSSKPAEAPAPAPHKDVDRRAFIKTSALAVGALAAGSMAKAQEMKVDGGLAPLEDKQTPERSCKLVPPGALSVKNLQDHCTACQLCVASCPEGVLHTSTEPGSFLQPYMNFENSYCRPECTACSNICPAGAIRPISREQKTSIRIGTARVNYELCLAYKGEAGCGNCTRHCPTGAVTMVREGGKRFPVVAEEQCIGCGACEHLCPSRPLSAITVNGLDTHIIK